MRIVRIAIEAVVGVAVLVAVILVATRGTGSQDLRRDRVQPSVLTGTSVGSVQPATTP
jgi:hypothetical protein